MLRRAVASIVFATVLVSCDDLGPPNQPPAPPEQQRDAAPEGRAPEPADAMPDRRAELAGVWRAEADTDDYGRITAELWVDRDGSVTYTLTGGADTVTDGFYIEHWDGRMLRVRDRDDRRFWLPATRQEETVTATLPIIGDAVFTRVRAATARTDPAGNRGDSGAR